MTSNTNVAKASIKPNQIKTISSCTPEEFREFQDKYAKKYPQSAAIKCSHPGHRTYRYGELLNMDFKRAPWLFEGLMRDNEVAMIYAATGVGKTWLTLALAMVAAGGGKVLDWANDAPRKVLYLDGEMDTGELVARMRQLVNSLGCDVTALGENLVLCPRQMQRNIGSGFIEIETEESQLGILRHALENSFSLIVIDNLTTLTGQLDRMLQRT